MTLFTDLYKNCKTYELGKKEILVSPNEAPRGVFLLRNGFVKAYDINHDGSCQINSIIGPGSLFPLPWAIEDENPTLFYEAMSNVSISLMSKKDFTKQVFSNNTLLKAILNELIYLYKLYQDRIKNLGLTTAHEKVAYRLLFLATFHGNKKDKNIVITAPSSYQDIADALNMTRETVNRVMKVFIEKNIITKNRDHVIVTGIDMLKEVTNHNNS